MSAFSFLTGVLTGAVAFAAGQWLWRRFIAGRQIALQPMALIAAGLVGTFAVAVGVMYLVIARPHGAPVTTQAAAPHAVRPDDAAGQDAQTMEAATAGLAARLARSGGSDQDWELLAKSYEFMGRAEDARLAREHKVSATATSAAAASSGTPGTLAQGETPSAPANAAAMRADLERKLKSNPKDVEVLLDLAALDQSERQYAKARERYLQVIALKRMTADSWADYADVLAALAKGSLAGEASQAIDRSLALDPRNEKALWLKASLAYQEHRYADSLALWKTLRAALPAGSPDISAVDSNIEEATQLVAGTGGAPSAGSPAAPVAATSNVAISGTVSIDSKLAAQVGHDATLFIYARAAGEQGPPLAVVRLPAGTFPVSFRLDDSQAMIPTRRLSQFDKVVVEARVSRSGQAAPTSGDLYVTSEVIRPADGKKLSLVINQKIG